MPYRGQVYPIVKEIQKRLGGERFDGARGLLELLAALTPAGAG